jgi:CheY-like chemotaxis protein
VTEANSAAEALDLLSEERFDLVITDQAMPRVTGLELARAAREAAPAMAIIVATGYADLAAGADLGLPRLPKPFWQAELAGAIAVAATKRTVPAE